MSTHPKIIIEAGKENSLYWRDLWKFKGLFYFLSWRDILVRYKQASIGVLWAVIRPLLTILLLSAVRWIFQRGDTSDGVPILLLIAAGTLPWTYFSSTFSDMANSLIANANLISKVYFPRLIVPASTIIVCLIDFLISLVILLALMLIYQYPLHWGILLMPVFLLIATLAALGMGLFFSALNVKYRDFRFVIPFLVQFGTYAAPVMYSSEQIYQSTLPEWLKFLYALNPMVSVIDGFRWCIFGNVMQIHWLEFWLSIGMTLLFLVLGVRTFRRMEKTFVDVYKMKYVVLSLCACAMLTACSYPTANLEAPAENVIKLGKRFRINLPETHKDGHAWTLNPKYDQGVVSCMNSVWHGPEKGVDYNFESLQTGSTELTFYMIGYQDTTATKHFIVRVE